MGDQGLKADELFLELARLQQRAKELFAQHNQVHHELVDVLEKIGRLTDKSARPVIAPDSRERKSQAAGALVCRSRRQCPQAAIFARRRL
jgi:hypothetical protein